MYSFATILIPSLLTAPRYFAGEVEFGVIAQATYAFDRMNDALTTFIDQFEQISGLSAQTERLVTLVELMERSAKDDTANELSGPSKITRDRVQPPYVLQIEQLNFRTPGGEQLIASDQNLILHEGREQKIFHVSKVKGDFRRVFIGDGTFRMRQEQSVTCSVPSVESRKREDCHARWRRDLLLTSEALHATRYLPSAASLSTHFAL